MTNTDIGKLLLRLLVGSLMLFHGIAKINHGIAFITSKVTQAGLPEFLSYGVYIGEIIAPILLIIGLKTRFAAFIIASTMLFAVFLVHSNDLFALTTTGAWALELQMFYFGSAIIILFMGAGKISWDKE